MRTDVGRLGGLRAVEKFLALTDGLTEQPLLTEQGYIDRVLTFANALEGTAGSAELFDFYFELVTANQLDAEEREDSSPSNALTQELRGAQAQLIKWLEVVQGERPNAIAKLAPIVGHAGERTASRCAYIPRVGGFEVRYRYYPADLEAAFGYALLLLLDRTRPYGNALCRCKFFQCRRFFLEVKKSTGRPRRDYCIREHFDAARAASAAERIRKYRKNKRAKHARAIGGDRK